MRFAYCLGARPLSFPLFDKSTSDHPLRLSLSLATVSGTSEKKGCLSLFLSSNHVEPPLNLPHDAVKMWSSRSFTRCAREVLVLEQLCFLAHDNNALHNAVTYRV